MIAAEYTTGTAVVRVHDDFCGIQIEQRLARINDVVSQSYRRRTVEQKECRESVVPMQADAGSAGRRYPNIAAPV
ncbi:hypothetical protein [Agathobaculum desmolans]|uniref:hypothetical protein n=1 Tax=Agathobaculum desmolans TaxID=39484 RepID=UPI00248F0A1C|nr:hypothetical protein [Agathobaculum desmolans]